MSDSELKIQPESFVPFYILVETTDLAYFELKAAIAEQDDSYIRLKDAELVLKTFDHHFNPDNKDDFVPSKSADFTLRLHKLVSIPKPIVKDPNQEYARDACVSGSWLLLEHNWQDKGRTFRDYLRRFMRLVLKSLSICDVEES